jgi:hypothetical protein
VHARRRDSSATAASTASALREATTTWPRRPRSPRRSSGRCPGSPGHHHGLAGDTEELVGAWGRGSRSWKGTVPQVAGIGNVRIHGSPTVHLDLTDEQLELQARLRAYFADLVDASTTLDRRTARPT